MDPTPGLKPTAHSADRPGLPAAVKPARPPPRLRVTGRVRQGGLRQRCQALSNPVSNPPPEPVPAPPAQALPDPVSLGLVQPRRAVCPICQGRLRRVHRRAEDHARTDAETLRRYHCRDADCDWEGLLASRLGRASRRAAVPGEPGARPSADTGNDTGTDSTADSTADTTTDAPADTRPSEDAPAAHLAGRSRRAMRSRRAGRRQARPSVWVGRVITAVLVLIALATAATIARLNQNQNQVMRGGKTIPPGASYFGDPLPRSHPLLTRAVYSRAPAAPAAGVPAATALTLREGCVWGQPGSNRYRGSIEQALAAMRLPPQVAATLAQQIRQHAMSDRVEIRNDAITGLQTQAVFDPHHLALTFGETLCIASRVHFAPGHTELADLYQAKDAAGNRYSVMLPDVCGNLSLLSEAREHGNGDGDVMALMTGDWSDGGDYAGGPRWRGAHADQASFAAATQDLPEPGTLACVLAGLAAWGVLARLRRASVTQPSASLPRRPKSPPR